MQHSPTSQKSFIRSDLERRYGRALTDAEFAECQNTLFGFFDSLRRMYDTLPPEKQKQIRENVPEDVAILLE